MGGPAQEWSPGLSAPATIHVYPSEGPGSPGCTQSSGPLLTEEQVAWCLGCALRALTSLLHPLPPPQGEPGIPGKKVRGAPRRGFLVGVGVWEVAGEMGRGSPMG